MAVRIRDDRGAGYAATIRLVLIEERQMAKKVKPKMTPLERSIAQRERCIETAKERIAAIRERSNEEIRKIENSMARNKILLDALKSGALKL